MSRAGPARNPGRRPSRVATRRDPGLLLRGINASKGTDPPPRAHAASRTVGCRDFAERQALAGQERSGGPGAIGIVTRSMVTESPTFTSKAPPTNSASERRERNPKPSSIAPTTSDRR